MSRILLVLTLQALLLAGLAPAPAKAATPQHSVAITGEGVGTYPSFSRGVTRYALTTTAETAGTVRVEASTTDPDGSVRINGVRRKQGLATLSGLDAGDEVSILINDSVGTTSYSFIYLPVGFPELERVAAEAPGGPSAGHVMLTLGYWTQPGPFFETVVDANGVPVYVRSVQNSMDLKLQPNGNYSVARSTGDGRGADIVELDSQFREVRRHRTVGLYNTDTHDSILLPDGTAYLLAYEPNDVTGKTDAIVQHVDPAGSVLFEWNSQDHVDLPAETVVGDDADYAHVNSIDIMDDGHLLVSFRHFSSVFKIARHPRDGHAVGEVIWKLGGRASDFTFVDQHGQVVDGGPCAQHTASELPGGRIMVFDNGAWNINPLCPDPQDPSGDPVSRMPSRVAVWELDVEAGVATMVREHVVDDRYAIFAGSAQPLDGGNTLIGWASARAAVVSEVDDAGRVVWELRDTGTPAQFTYRAFKAHVPDATKPDVRVDAPRDGATYLLGSRSQPRYSCTDRGGSNLQSCDATPIDTSSLGQQTAQVVALDGAGNKRTVRRSYTVTPPAHQPDAMLRREGGRRFIGRNEFGAKPRQVVQSSIWRREGRSIAVVQIRNVGTRADRFSVSATASSRVMAVKLRFPQGVRTSPRLKPGETWRFRVVVTRKASTRDGQSLTERLEVRSLAQTRRTDVVWFKVVAR